MRTKIVIQYPALNHEECVANIRVNTTNIDTENGMSIENVHEYDIRNGLFINIINKGEQGLLTFVAGDKYPNSMLGNIVIEIPEGISAINIQDIQRFIRNDGNVYIDFNKEFNGELYIIAKYGSRK